MVTTTAAKSLEPIGLEPRDCNYVIITCGDETLATCCVPPLYACCDGCVECGEPYVNDPPICIRSYTYIGGWLTMLDGGLVLSSLNQNRFGDELLSQSRIKTRRSKRLWVLRNSQFKLMYTVILGVI